MEKGKCRSNMISLIPVVFGLAAGFSGVVGTY